MREHDSGKWTFAALQKAIKQEIHIFELEIQTSHETQTQLHATALFTHELIRARKPCQSEKSKNHLCVFFKGSHAPIECNAVSDPDQ